jgi:hypothetical protein
MVNMHIKALILFSHMLYCLQFNALFVRRVSRNLYFPTLYAILGGPTEPENWDFAIFIIVYF